MQLFPLRLIPTETTLDFIGKKKAAWCFSLLLLLTSVFLLTTKGLNFGIDFTGGIVIESRFAETPDIATLRTLLSEQTDGEIQIQEFGNTHDVLIRMQGEGLGNEQASHAADVIKQTLLSHYPDLEIRKVDLVGPQVGKELIRAGAMALCFSVIAILLYVWLRFEWQYGIGAVTALLHDAMITLGFFSLTGLEFNLTSIAAILTIIGYSINDTVVIYDRMRENIRYDRTLALPLLINKSINETLSRTLLTVITTMIALSALVLFGGSELQSFSLSVLFGITIGTYSSIYIAASVIEAIRPKTKAKKEGPESEGMVSL